MVDIYKYFLRIHFFNNMSNNIRIVPKPLHKNIGLIISGLVLILTPMEYTEVYANALIKKFSKTKACLSPAKTNNN